MTPYRKNEADDIGSLRQQIRELEGVNAKLHYQLRRKRKENMLWNRLTRFWEHNWGWVIFGAIALAIMFTLWRVDVVSDRNSAEASSLAKAYQMEHGIEGLAYCAGFPYESINCTVKSSSKPVYLDCDLEKDICYLSENPAIEKLVERSND